MKNSVPRIGGSGSAELAFTKLQPTSLGSAVAEKTYNIIEVDIPIYGWKDPSG